MMTVGRISPPADSVHLTPAGRGPESTRAACAGLINVNRYYPLLAINGVTLRETGHQAMLKAGWTIFATAAIVVVIAFGAAQLVVPDVVPIGSGEEAQAAGRC